MSMSDDIKKGGLTTLAIGMGVLSLVPAVLPVLAQGVRPLLKGAVKGGLVCLEKGQEAVAEIRQVLEEVATEAQAESQAVKPVKRTVHGPLTPRPAEPETQHVMSATGEPDPESMG